MADPMSATCWLYGLLGIVAVVGVVAAVWLDLPGDSTPPPIGDLSHMAEIDQKRNLRLACAVARVAGGGLRRRPSRWDDLRGARGTLSPAKGPPRRLLCLGSVDGQGANPGSASAGHGRAR